MAQAESPELELVGQQSIVLEDVPPDELTQFLESYTEIQRFDSVEFVLSGDDARMMLDQDSVASPSPAQVETDEAESDDDFEVTGQAAEVLRVIHEHRGWIRSKDLESSDELDIAKTSMTSILWQLSNADYLEKRDYAEDKRQNEYRATELAEEAL